MLCIYELCIYALYLIMRCTARRSSCYSIVMHFDTSDSLFPNDIMADDSTALSGVYTAEQVRRIGLIVKYRRPGLSPVGESRSNIKRGDCNTCAS